MFDGICNDNSFLLVLWHLPTHDFLEITCAVHMVREFMRSFKICHRDLFQLIHHIHFCVCFSTSISSKTRNLLVCFIKGTTKLQIHFLFPKLGAEKKKSQRVNSFPQLSDERALYPCLPDFKTQFLFHHFTVKSWCYGKPVAKYGRFKASE